MTVPEAPARLVRELMEAPAAAPVRAQRLKSRVHRLECTWRGRSRSFVAKRLDPEIARRNELVARRWLPAAGLACAGPPLLAVAAEPDGAFVWHVHEDLGDCGLDAAPRQPDRLAVAVTAIGRLHAAFARHPLLPECRLWGGDHGISAYASSVGDAIASLEALPPTRLTSERAALRDRLLERLRRLEDEHAARAATLSRAGGPETLLHGDLWPMNVMVVARSGGLAARLIDWDHAGVGPVTYDLSTFLGRLPAEIRLVALRLYEDAGGSLPPAAELNAMFETAELGRIANRVIWPALAAWEDGADWAFAALAEVERWFAALTPVLASEDA